MEMRLYIERNVKLKFKGCNHPQRLLNRPRRQNSSPDHYPPLTLDRRNAGPFRSSSMTQLRIIRNVIREGKRESLSRQRYVY